MGSRNAVEGVQPMFERYAALDGSLPFDGFRDALEVGRRAEGLAEPLPGGFLMIVYEAWTQIAKQKVGIGRIDSANFLPFYRLYFRHRQSMLSDWLSGLPRSGTRDTYLDQKLPKRV